MSLSLLYLRELFHFHYQRLCHLPLFPLLMYVLIVTVIPCVLHLPLVRSDLFALLVKPFPASKAGKGLASKGLMQTIWWGPNVSTPIPGIFSSIAFSFLITSCFRNPFCFDLLLNHYVLYVVLLPLLLFDSVMNFS